MQNLKRRWINLPDFAAAKPNDLWDAMLYKLLYWYSSLSAWLAKEAADSFLALLLWLMVCLS